MRAPSPWREPDAETEDYPGLFVHDGRVSGSITLTRSRLSVWAIVGYLSLAGWPAVHAQWPYVEREYAWNGERLGSFLSQLLDQRGEFARLLCILADEERRDRERTDQHGDLSVWWERAENRQRVREALQRCLDALQTAQEGAA